MKLNAREAEAWIARPSSDRPGTLLYGDDAMRVALKRQALVLALIGPRGDEEMRLTRIPAAELRREKTLLADALKAQGFFPGAQVALVEEVTNQHADLILAALADWRPGDAHVVVTAGALKPASALRKGFEKHPKAATVAIYDTPPTREEIRSALQAAGLKVGDGEALTHLSGLAQRVDPGDFRQLVEKIAVFKHGDPAPLTLAEIDACAPASTEAEVDDVVAVVADGKTGEIGQTLRRLQGQGVLPVTLCIGTMRHFRQLHAIASDPGGAGQGIGRLRPPVFGPRRDALLRQAQNWGTERLEQAIRLLVDTDLSLRSSAKAPQAAVMERALIRLAMMGRR